MPAAEVDTTLNERLFAPPEADAVKIEERQSKLPAAIRALILQAGEALDRNRPDLAANALADAMASAPAQADILRLSGLLLARLGNFEAAKENFERALQQAPDDALIFQNYAQACELAGDIEAALRLRKQAVDRLPDSPLAWFDLGQHYSQYESIEGSLVPLVRAAELAPRYAPALLKLGNALIYCGRLQEGAAAYRSALDSEPESGTAWYSLANIKTQPFTQAEVAQMRQLLRNEGLGENERIAIEFALAKACEDDGLYEEAYSLLVDANARKRRQLNWSASRFSTQVRRAEKVFAAPHATVQDPRFGEETIFIVGLPRSGTTLTEQIIASQSRVAGAGELDDLGRILGEESARRRQHYPDWIGQATPQDWQRLGQRYLDSTARWRNRHPRFTDKMPNNWLFLGAIRAMLPGSRVVICRRDPIENCWSCFKQFFVSNWEFAFNFDDIAAYWKDFDRTASSWSSREPSHIRELSYEALIANPEVEIRKLLDFCDLPFEASCLNFHAASRSVRTASAGQVRQPMQKNTARALRYGALLDPLRAALGLHRIAESGRQ